MLIYQRKGEKTNLKLDGHSRDLRLTWPDFELLMETLHGYVNEALIRRPKKEVTELANRLNSQWHQQDREKKSWLRRD